MARLALLILAAILAAAGSLHAAPPAIDHATWDALLKEYVDERQLVDYRRLKAEALPALESYLAQLAAPWPKALAEPERKAALINAYNAFTVAWVLRHYPVVSIWKTAKPFTARRHTMDGGQVSLDEIETRLRGMGDPRIHAALVCAARSCPPLRREAYVAARLQEQLEDNTRAWLANATLHEFLPERRLARVSSIFKWYRSDFEGTGKTLGAFLATYGPAGASFAARPGTRIEFKEYHWGLNDAAGLGRDYSSRAFYLDYVKSKAR